MIAVRLLLTCLSVSLTRGSILSPPRDAYYWNGRDTQATLTCIIDVPVNNRVVVWSHNDKILVNSTKHSISDGDVTGDFSLTIYKLSRNDGGQYVCQIVGGGEDSLRKATITVAGKSILALHAGKSIITAPLDFNSWKRL